MNIERLILLCIWLSLSAVESAYSCTILYYEKDGIILAGNNEDWKDPLTHLWIYAPGQETHGWVKFGFGSGFPQGGMNDQGVFWDATAGPHKEMPYSESNKTFYTGVLMKKVIEKSSNVSEAKSILQNFYSTDQYRAQYLIGDALGTSMIAEGDSFLMKQLDYQVLTNFYQSEPDLGGYPCWRYETANELLAGCDSLTPYYIGKVLASTCQDGNYPTQYSNIYDLKNRRVYLFYYHNFKEFLVIDLLEEIEKGDQTYKISSLFSQIGQLTPAEGDSVYGTEVTISWTGLPGCSYRIIYATNPQFVNPLLVDAPYISEYTGTNASAAILLPLLFLVVLFSRRRNLAGISLFLITTIATGLHCEKEGDMVDQESDTKQSVALNNLEPGTTYFWKIEAINNKSAPFTTQTIVQSFRTVIK